MTTTSTANPSELVNGSSPFSSRYVEASIIRESDILTNTDKSMTQTSHNQYKSSTTLSSRHIFPESKNLVYSVTRHGSNELINMPSNITFNDNLGPNRDGRVRSPVPSNLKGKTSSKQRNFGIMHMDMNNEIKDDPKIQNDAAEHVMAARKISEATGYQAKVTKLDQHVPPMKRIAKGVFDDSESNYESSPVISKEVCTRQLAPGDTKIEQARLLILLRSINPLIVVDQLCKAVAYFGGIPGAPPPEDGTFPKSVISKETGALFIGWVAEIFPDLSFRYPRISKEVPFRSEGTKADSLVESCDVVTRDDALSNELPNSKNGHISGTAFSGYPWALSLNDSIIAGNTKLIEQQLNSPSVKEHAEETSLTPTCKRKRGRPKGSRNKKFLGPQSLENPVKSVSNSEPQEINIIASEILNMSSEAAPNQFNRSYHDVFREKTFSQAETEHKQPHKDRKLFWIDSQKNNCRSKLNENITTDFEFNTENRAILEASRNDESGILNTEKSSEQGPKESYSDTKVQEQIKNVASFSSTVNRVSSSRTKNTSSIRNPENPQGGLNTSKPENSIDNAKNQVKLLSAIDKSNLSVSYTKAPDQKYHNSVENTAQNPVNPEDRDGISSISLTAKAENKIMLSRNDASLSPPFHDEHKNNHKQLSNLHQFQTRGDIPTSISQQQTLLNSVCSSSSNQHATPLTPQQKIIKDNQKSQHNEISTPRPLKRPIPTSFFNQKPQASMANLSYSQPSTQVYSGNQASSQINHGTYQNSSSFTQSKSQFSSSESNYGTLSSYNVSQSSPPYFQNEDAYGSTTSQEIKHSTSLSNTKNDHRNSNTHSIAQQIQSFQNLRTQDISQSTQNAYGQLNETSFNDLPTLGSLGHVNNSMNSNLISSNCGYGQNLGVNIGTSRAMTGSNHLYGGAALNTYEANTDYVRAVNPHNSHNSSSTLYTNPSPGQNNSYDVTTTNNAKDRLMRASERYW
ncbi:hypothetical protein GcC1_203004 [Golovinomyces cichoracearum]|uniref:Hmg-i hmg-dna-binding protein n=1 Tax=Golovinomyces cichoracearum TaxID=62708 RepID=A0A420HDN2_9PEZI|nr:hypothetical protein GcC1_203004 [Golovinomyces cichoracearum]